MSEIRGGWRVRPFKAKLMIPCLINQCAVPKGDGTMRRSRMHLKIWRDDGVLLERPYNDGPHYKCERQGCYYHDHPRGAHEINTEWIRDIQPYKDYRTLRDSGDVDKMREVLA